MSENRDESSPTTVFLDGESLTPEVFVELSKGEMKIDVSPEVAERIREGREVVDEIVEAGDVVYGINTGFGNFANVVIPSDKLNELQVNLIRSHASGVGEPLTVARTRMLLCLRINVLAKGHSGIRMESVQKMIDAFNKGCLSVIPAKGTVGASGDLAPLAHLALGLIGEGKMWNPDGSGMGDAGEILAANGLSPLELTAKEGLAMINGTQLITSLGAEAVVRARRIARQADVVTALTLEALRGSVRAFHPSIHLARPHSGQIMSASRLRALLHSPAQPSQLAMSHVNCGRVQDSYTMRCSPQVHGAASDTIDTVYNTLLTEMNSATDNPMVFVGDDTVVDEREHIAMAPGVPVCQECEHLEARLLCDECGEGSKFCRNCYQRLHFSRRRRTHKPVTISGGTPTAKVVDLSRRCRTGSVGRARKGFIISGGNFHGEYPAKACDILAIAVSEIATISERRVERLVNPALSDLPAFLLPPGAGGLHSGFMIAHCTAAALVSENKVLCHPASVDSIPTSAAKEDHVSMGGFAARKALEVVEHVEMVVAIELVCAAQALDLLRPLTSTAPLEALHATLRKEVAFWDRDRYMAPDLEAAAALLRRDDAWNVVQPFVESYPARKKTVDAMRDAAASAEDSAAAVAPAQE